MPNSSSRKTCYWIREGKSFSSTGKRSVRKGFRFQFPDAFENSNFRPNWYALRVPIFTKTLSCPFNLDQKRLLEVKQLVWVQNRPLLKYEIQIKWPFSAHQFIIHESTYLSEWCFKRNNYTRGTWRGYAIVLKREKSSLCIKYIFTIRLFPKACVKTFVIIRIYASEIP